MFGKLLGGKLLGHGDKGIGEILSELRQVTVDYTKQETLEPLKNLGRYIAFGTAGTILFSVGFIFWTFAGLRALQEETGTVFTGHWSWAPYMLTLLGSVVVIAVCVSAIFKEKNAAKKRKQEREAL